MAYDATNPAALLYAAGIGNAFPQTWGLKGTDAVTVVRVTGYISNAKQLGMKAGDVVYYRLTSTNAITIMTVLAINANGSADLSDGLAVGVTNTD